MGFREDRLLFALSFFVVMVTAGGALLRYLDERPMPVPDPFTVTPASEEERWTLGLPVRVNRASAEALDLLPDIGSRRAQAIVDFRSAKGRYESIEDLDQVKGIGPATLEKIRSQVSFEDAPSRDRPITVTTVPDCECLPDETGVEKP